MQQYNNILEKLNLFTKKFYGKMLIKGFLLFLVLGLLAFILVLGVEYMLWLGSMGRLLLLLILLAISLYLLFHYIITPIFYLLKIRGGISNKQASLLIGKHFPEVGDKLYNLLELAEDKNQSELLLASIHQRSSRLAPIAFGKAITFGDSFRYAKYLVIPLVFFGVLWISGNLDTFFGSYTRVVNYNLAYSPPAPFEFKLLSNELNVLESEPFRIEVITEGKVRPKDIFIVLGGTDYLLQENNGIYSYTLTPPIGTANFYFVANGIKSDDYRLNSLHTPAIQDFNMILNYPKHTRKGSETVKSTGNAIFPEGTQVRWEIRGEHTGSIDLLLKDTTEAFNRKSSTFYLSKRVFTDLPYQIATSNVNVQEYEKLEYRFKVIRDETPTIKVRQVLDSLNPNLSYYIGEAADDYELAKLRLMCYTNTEHENIQMLDLGAPNANFNRFYYTFPSGLVLEEGETYSFYFEAIDNDGVHGGKSAKSQIFTTVFMNGDQLLERDLQQQQTLISTMDRSLEKFKEQKRTLEEINTDQKEKSQLTFNDKNQIKDFLRKQEQQENLMKKFSRQLKENLENKETDDQLNALLKERLERQELEAKRNEKLLQELNEIAEKIDKEELAKRLEELGKKQRNSERNLEQLLELTKRYYVTEKASQLAKELAKQAERQKNLSELRIGEDFSEKEQEKLNKQFAKTAEELEELKKDNEDLKKPLELELDKVKSEGVKKDQEQALEEIIKYQGEEQANDVKGKQGNADKAKESQKSAAEKMQEMSDALETSSSQAGSGTDNVEDAAMLRQILDNLITFSFNQEALFDSLEDNDVETSQFSSAVRKQQELKALFEHVDDSLFALSLRRAELSEYVNEQITEVYYNMDRALESIADSQLYQGVSYQKYILNASNGLADFLANILDNMQQSMMPGAGSGAGPDFQLPDIIKGQGELKKKMEGMGKPGEGAPAPGEGEGEGDGKGKEGQGEKGLQGDQGKTGEKTGNEGDAMEGDDKGNGQGRGNGTSKGGQGMGEPSESELREIYEIYKEQQYLRERLEQQLEDMINSSDRKLGEKLLRQMEDFERDLLENGITDRNMTKVNTIEYELLKLENAALKQGEKQERESNTNAALFQNPITTKPSILKNYQDEIEILNRQALPLRQNFKHKVKVYFKSND